ncbi:type II toxin-antitoxin system YhaV family toxin [Proteus appendicitidis]|uniref:Type II toxin-antitoxin system YhaV family toxin n=1 Tax=Proteus appendicitidis TaxID=3034648 RepID=A0ABY8Y7J3_9GAMM|nr:type II toxin-antitoxin system YhaV family toxin [Proteus sp. HZ0627]WIV87936.1 type II toxin-antitoxin system YhaV family toxin [Proteus sp. HZ0627]
MDTLEINGWKIFFHQCFLDQIIELIENVKKLKASDPSGYKKKSATKLLTAIKKVIEERIARNPLDPIFHLGNTLGSNNKHWFRAKFLQQFRLFFRCSEEHKIIVIGLVNDFNTLRAYDSKSDAYKVFSSKLKAGKPPNDWQTLLKEASATAGAETLSIQDFFNH